MFGGARASPICIASSPSRRHPAPKSSWSSGSKGWLGPSAPWRVDCTRQVTPRPNPRARCGARTFPSATTAACSSFLRPRHPSPMSTKKRSHRGCVERPTAVTRPRSSRAPRGPSTVKKRRWRPGSHDATSRSAPARPTRRSSPRRRSSSRGRCAPRPKRREPTAIRLFHFARPRTAGSSCADAAGITASPTKSARTISRPVQPMCLGAQARSRSPAPASTSTRRTAIVDPRLSPATSPQSSFASSPSSSRPRARPARSARTGSGSRSLSTSRWR